MILAWTGDALSHGQAQNGVNFDFEGKFDLEGKGESPLKTIGILTKVFYTWVSNLVILAWTGLKLSRGQASDWHTDWHTDAGNDNTRRPKLASGKKLHKHQLTFILTLISTLSIKPLQQDTHIFIQLKHNYTYRQVSNIRRTLVGNEIVDHSDVVWASPVGATPTTSSFST